ncbi:MAG: PDZ domain-containing protein, partial [bacterium]
LYRFTIGLFALYLIGIGIRNFYRYASSTTDDNLFRNSPSHFYITKSFSTHNLDQIVSPIQSNSANLDSIYVGDLLVGINEHIINQDAQVHQLLQTIPNDSGCVLTIFRTTENKFVDYDVSRAALPDSFFQILPVSVYVMEIYPDGASDLAGLKVGDLILRINGETFKDDFDADRILRRAKSGTTIAYDIIRNNQTLTIPVTVANFGVNLAILIVFLSGLVYLSTGTFIAIKSPNILAARLIGLTFMTFGFLLMVTMIQRDVEFDLFATIRTLTLMASLPFTIAFWSHSKSHFPQVRAEIINKHWLSRIPYVLALLFFIIFSLFVFQVIQNNHILNISFIIMLVLMCGYHLAVQSIFHKQRTPEYKKLNRVIFWTGITAGMSALALALILYRSHAYQQMGFIGLPLVFIPLSYLYTIGRYQLLEMKLHVRRNIQYIIVSSLWVTVLVIILLNILITLPNLHFAIPNVHLSGNSIVILDKPPPPQLYDFLQKLL